MANDYFIKYVIVINYIYHDIISKLKYNMFKMRVWLLFLLPLSPGADCFNHLERKAFVCGKHDAKIRNGWGHAPSPRKTAIAEYYATTLCKTKPSAGFQRQQALT